jgi:hypothetical protein
MENTENPSNIFEFESNNDLIVHYTVSKETSTPVVEITKLATIENRLETCAISLIKNEIQIHLYTGEQLFRVCVGGIRRFMLFEHNDTVHERLIIDVTKDL